MYFHSINPQTHTHKIYFLKSHQFETFITFHANGRECGWGEGWVRACHGIGIE
jgi:hypothetical protein